jgi:hypothetical protein
MRWKSKEKEKKSKEKEQKSGPILKVYVETNFYGTWSFKIKSLKLDSILEDFEVK